jgi:peptidoglycan/xylan/chitin deacetylase (PgdA/CDA1 family)
MRHCRGLHGYTHEYMSQLSEKQERDVLRKSIEVLSAFTGVKPKGFTAPAWMPSPRTVSLKIPLPLPPSVCLERD